MLRVLAELEVYHSRPVAPTRRVALGHSNLPTDPAPGFGGILLGGIVASTIRDLDADLMSDIVELTHQIERGGQISQPRLRHRFQVDRVGLQRSRFKLIQRGAGTAFDFGDAHGAPAQSLLGAVYAAGRVPSRQRHIVMAAVRKAARWSGPVGPELIDVLGGFSTDHSTRARVDDPIAWAMDVLGFDDRACHDPDRSVWPPSARTRPAPEPPCDGFRTRARAATASGRSRPTRSDVQQRFRLLLRDAHPDHGGTAVDAAQRIADLTAARRILIG